MENFLERPEATAELTRDELAQLFVKIKSLEGAVLARLLSGAHESIPDRVLSIEEMMQAMGVSRRWLFAHKALPFINCVSRKSLTGSERGMLKYLANKRRK